MTAMRSEVLILLARGCFTVEIGFALVFGALKLAIRVNMICVRSKIERMYATESKSEENVRD